MGNDNKVKLGYFSGDSNLYCEFDESVAFAIYEQSKGNRHLILKKCRECCVREVAFDYGKDIGFEFADRSVLKIGAEDEQS